jgi:hypothetical protein
MSRQNSYQPQMHAPMQAQAQPNRTSVMGGSMMGKMSSKFTQLHKGTGGTPSVAQPHGKAPTDWKKWAKRGAIGVAGIGALTLGIDAGEDMFSGAEAFGGGDFSGGGEDFSGGGYEGGDAAGAMDAQTAMDANAAQLNMEAVGRENSLMLLDPAGTECKYCDSNLLLGMLGYVVSQALQGSIQESISLTAIAD